MIASDTASDMASDAASNAAKIKNGAVKKRWHRHSNRCRNKNIYLVAFCFSCYILYVLFSCAASVFQLFFENEMQLIVCVMCVIVEKRNSTFFSFCSKSLRDGMHAKILFVIYICELISTLFCEAQGVRAANIAESMCQANIWHRECAKQTDGTENV